MAAADYMHCAICDGKAFYDAEIDWEHQHVAHDDAGYPISVTALCDECFKTHEIVVRPRALRGGERK